MSADVSASVPREGLLSAPRRARERLRLVALVGLIALWVLPDWVRVQIGDDFAAQNGAVRSGATAALALLALWGLAATSLSARTLRGLRIGAALTDAALALVVSWLLVARHPWIPGGEIREAWVPIFLPLALLALLEAGLLRARHDLRHEIAVIRAGAAFFAAGALAVDQALIPAGIALWLGAAPLMFLKLRSTRGARRSLEAFVLVAAVACGFAPWIQQALVGVQTASGSTVSLPVYLWCLTAALVGITALDGLLRPEAGTSGSGRGG